jgi:hypothetical protein
MSSTLECSHLFFFSLGKKKRTPPKKKEKKKNMKFLGFNVYLGFNNNLNPRKKKKHVQLKQKKCEVV